MYVPVSEVLKASKMVEQVGFERFSFFIVPDSYDIIKKQQTRRLTRC